MFAGLLMAAWFVRLFDAGELLLFVAFSNEFRMVSASLAWLGVNNIVFTNKPRHKFIGRLLFVIIMALCESLDIWCSK